MLYQVTVPLLEKIQDIAGFTVITELGPFVSGIVGMFLVIASVAAFLYLVLGGVQWILAGSDSGKLEEAKTRITNALIGLAIVAASWAIFLILNHFFGLNVASGNTGGGGGGGGGTGTAACVCGGGAGCASIGQVGSMNYAGTDCYTCTASGWVPQAGSCEIITCGSCPE